MDPKDTDSWMWERASELLERVDKLHRRFFQLGRSRYCRPTWELPIDIFEAEGALWIVAALPGVEPERVRVEMDAGILTISGERSIPLSCRGAAVLRLEIPQGRFERSLELPPGQFQVDRSELSCGCLVLCLRKL